MPIKRKKTITYKGETAKVSLMSYKYGVPDRTIFRRIQAGWSDVECMEGRSGRKNTRIPAVTITYAGKKGTLKQWAKYLGISVHTLTSRYRRGWAIKHMLYGRSKTHIGYRS